MNESYISIEFLKSVCSKWDIELSTLPNNLPIAGSPDRTEYRVVVQDVHERLYMLEKINQDNRKVKENITKALSFLYKKNLSFVQPYIKTVTGDSLISCNGEYWQLIPFIKGMELDRPQYLKDAWRGKAIAEFLIELEEKSIGIEEVVDLDYFSIIEFINDFKIKLEENNPKIFNHLKELFEYLDSEFVYQHQELADGFCHGDIHPLNIIWGNDEIRSVIDWEFHGRKPKLYDLANLIGCLGMEAPDGLLSSMILQLFSELKDRDYIEPLGNKVLLDFVLAIRFAWLSDWLRRKDNEMINLEIAYMFLLFDNRNIITSKWNL